MDRGLTVVKYYNRFALLANLIPDPSPLRRRRELCLKRSKAICHCRVNEDHTAFIFLVATKCEAP
jgi:hypothetical protein|tara:strand:- start:829 stop:1023 length:195 start_codon:yes stop_codon:yes gene_type:complete